MTSSSNVVVVVASYLALAFAADTAESNVVPEVGWASAKVPATSREAVRTICSAAGVSVIKQSA